MNKLPRHIAIIMDGNGRWATKRNLPRIAGHKTGGEAAKKVIRACAEKGIEILTLFAFGSDNWKRPKSEINFLMNTFLKILQKDTKELHENNIQLRIIGDHTQLNSKLQDKISCTQQLTAANTGLKLNAAINYSGRWDILTAVKNLIPQITSDELTAEQITQDHLQAMLCLSNLPEPDLLIRTSGEQRLSNFMLWQLAYTELYFTDILWPDFNAEALDQALQAYAQRKRRFGGLKEC